MHAKGSCIDMTAPEVNPPPMTGENAQKTTIDDQCAPIC